MPAISITGTQTKSTSLNAVSTNQLIDFGTLTLTTGQSLVTAFIVSYDFESYASYPPDGSVYLFSCPALATLPLKIGTSNTVTALLSAQTGEGELGVQTAIFTMTLSAQALSSNGAVLSAISVSPTTISVSLSTLSLTALNLPFGGQICWDQHRRQRLLGNI